MSTAPRMVVVLSAAVILASVTPTASAAPLHVAPEPAVSCQLDVEAYPKASVEIHAAEHHATRTERRTLHLELVQLRRDVDLQPC